jgi:hypothetical protein
MTATYLGSGDTARRRTDYYPVWLNKLADDVTLEASAMVGAAQGPEAIRSIILAVKSLYEYQDINFAGDYGGHYFIEDYTTQIQGEPFGVMGVITRNAAGQTEHIVINQRPRSTLLLVARLLAEKFKGTPTAEYFAGSES